jgi:hypothetical protein
MNSTPVRDRGAKTMRDDAQYVACASLKKVDLFSTLPNSKLYDLAGATRFRKVESRELLVAPSAAPNCLHFLIQGAGKVSRSTSAAEKTFYQQAGRCSAGPSRAHDAERDDRSRARAVYRVRCRQGRRERSNTTYLSAVDRSRRNACVTEERLDELTMARTSRTAGALRLQQFRSPDCGQATRSRQDFTPGIVRSTRDMVNAILETFVAKDG